MGIKMTMIYHTGRSRTVEADSKHSGGPLHLSRALPAGAVLHPVSIEEARKLINHLEETIALMKPVKRRKFVPQQEKADAEEQDGDTV